MNSKTSTMVPPMRLPTTGLPAWLCFGNVVVVAAPAAIGPSDHALVSNHVVTATQRRRCPAKLGKQVASDVGDLDLVGSGVDLEDLCVTGKLLDAILGDVAVSTEQLHGFHGNF